MTTTRAARQIRRSGTNRAHLLMMSITSLLLPTVNCQLCEPLYDNTWSGLREAIDFSFDFAILCPFRISGDGCPKNSDGYQVKSQDLYIMCESFFGRGDESSCVIDCPGTHFTVFPQASLTLDGITLQGSTNSAVRVKPTAAFTCYNSNFKDNSNLSGNGGAIDAEPESRITLMYSTFENNEALNGGALYHRGRALIKGTKFLDNVATNGGGGAIFSGSQSETGLVQDLFQGNQASFFGPAVFDGSDATSIREGNTACGNAVGNTLGGSSVVCDGVYLASGGTGQCNPFEFQCVAPTMPPTMSPAPSVSPSSGSPSVTPSHEPSTVPSSTPSSVPTPSPIQTPTLNPTPLPTHDPTSNPTPSSTQAAADIFSVEATLSPSLPPSNPPSPSGEPSAIPTSVKSPTGSPTLKPSTAPPAPSVAPSVGSTPPLSTDGPTNPPSNQPSAPSAPTIAPSARPTQSPTSKPLSAPPSSMQTSSLWASSQPTVAPSLSPSMAPSLRGSSSPSRGKSNSPGAGKRR